MPSLGVEIRSEVRSLASICSCRARAEGCPSFFEVRLEEAQRQLLIPDMTGGTGVGERDAQCALIILGDALIGGARLRGAPRLIAQQRPVIAQVVLRPVRLLGQVEEGERLCVLPCAWYSRASASVLVSSPMVLALAALKCPSAAA